MEQQYDFLVLGASGMQGKIASRDLLDNGYSVFLGDLYKAGSEKTLQFPKTAFEFIDVRDVEAVKKLIERVRPSVIINCAEGDWNLGVYKAALATKTHVIDLGSDIEDTKEQLALGPFFKEDERTAITGCGSTPGINNVMLEYATHFFDTVESVNVGFAWDSNIKEFVVPFSVPSIIWEFTQPAPYIEDGVWKTANPIDTMEKMHFREIGDQECFLVTHPEIYSFFLYYQNEGLKNMKYYAGFPKHSADVIRTLIKLGFASWDPVQIENTKVVPVDFLAEVLRKIEPPLGYSEKEVLWVEVDGIKDGKPKKVRMECLVPTLPGWEDAGCNIDTGMTASIIAQMIKRGSINARGSFAAGSEIPHDEFFQELRKRQMVVYENDHVIN